MQAILHVCEFNHNQLLPVLSNFAKYNKPRRSLDVPVDAALWPCLRLTIKANLRKTEPPWAPVLGMHHIMCRESTCILAGCWCLLWFLEQAQVPHASLQPEAEYGTSDWLNEGHYTPGRSRRNCLRGWWMFWIPHEPSKNSKNLKLETCTCTRMHTTRVVHVHVCIHTYMYIHTYIHVCIPIGTYMYYAYMYMYGGTHVRMHTREF